MRFTAATQIERVVDALTANRNNYEDSKGNNL